MDWIQAAYRYRATPLGEREAIGSSLIKHMRAEQAVMQKAMMILREALVLGTQELQSQGVDVGSLMDDVNELERFDEESDDS